MALIFREVAMTRARTAGILALLVVAIPALLQGGDRKVNHIQEITFSEETNETVIKVSAAHTPTFSVFKLGDPVRLFIDVSGGDVEKVSKPILVDNGVIDRIGTLQFVSGGVPVGRIIVGLRENAPYDISSSGQDILVRIDGQNRRPTSEQAVELAERISSVKARLDGEKKLLSRIKRLREKEETLRKQEEASRKESERLRVEATALKKKAQQEAVLASETADRETKRLDLIRREKEIAANKRDAMAKAASAAREKASAMKRLAERATARRAAEEIAANKANEAEKAARFAVEAENKKLDAIRAARKAEERHEAALKLLATQEKEKLARAKAAREREEKLLERLSEARAREAKTAMRAKHKKDAVLAAQLENSRQKVAELEKRLSSERKKTAVETGTFEKALTAAKSKAFARKTDLAQARESMSKLGSHLKELQAERDGLAREAKTARAEAHRLRTLLDKAAAVAINKETDQKEAEAISKRLAIQKRELKVIAERKAREAETLSRVVESRKHAQSTWKDTTSKLAVEEKRLSQLVSKRSRIETSIDQLRSEVEELSSRRKSFQTAEAKKNKWKDDTIRDLADKIAKAQDDVSLSRKALSEREAEIRRLRISIKEAEDAGHTETSQLTQSLQRMTSEVQRVRSDLANRLAMADRLADKRALEIERLSHELDRFKSLGSEKVTADAKKMKGLKTELENRKLEIAVLKKAYSDAKKTGAGRLKDKKKRLADLKDSLDRQRAEVKRLTREYRSKTTSHDKRIETRDRRIATLTEQIEALKSANAARESMEVARLQKVISSRESELEALHWKNREETAKGDRMTVEMRTAGKKIAVVEKELGKLNQKLDKAIDREKTAREKELAASKRIDKMMHALDDTKAERDSLAQELAEVRKMAAKASMARMPRAGSVKSVDFKESGGVPSVVIKMDGRPEYSVISENGRTYVLTLKGVVLPKSMARRMDVSAFESPVSMVTTFSDGDGTVQVVADLGKPVGQKVSLDNGRLVWKFAGPPSSRMLAGAAPTPTMGASGWSRANAPDQGSSASSNVMIPNMASPKPDKDQKYRKPSLVPKKKRYKGKRINLTVKDADIQNVLTFLAREGRVNIVTSENVSGKVTFHLEDVPWDLALDTVLKTKGLDYVVEQGIFRVAPIDDIQREYEARVQKLQKVRELKPVLVRLIPVNYGDGNELLSKVKTVLSSKGTVVVDSRTNTLIIKDTEDYLEAAEELVKRLDQQTPQVLIEARIVEARTTFKEEIGIQWGGRFAMSSVYGNETGLVFPSSIGIAGGADDQSAPQGGVSIDSPNFAVNLPAAVGAGAGGALGIQLGSIGGASNLSLRLSAAEEEGQVKIISSPRISTLDNRKASISQGVSIPISVVSAAGVNTQFFSADLRLDVTPHVTRDGHILLTLDVSKNEPDFGNVAANGNPTIQKKEAHTELLIRDGDTTVIGGIYTRNKSKGFKKIPFFGDIPILGWFFKSRNRSDDRSELLIFITPKVVNREVAL